MSLLDLLLVIRRRVVLVFVVTAASLALAVIYATFAGNIYESKAVAVPTNSASESSQRSALGGLAALQKLTGVGADAPAAELIAILESRDFVERFVTKHNILPALFPERWDEAASRWIGKAPSVEAGARKFSRSVRTLSVDTETGFLQVRIRWKDSSLARKWTVATIADINEWMSTKAAQETKRDLAFLQQQMAATSSTEVRQGLSNLIKDHTEKLMLATGRSDYALRVIDIPMESEFPVWPRPLLIAACGIAAGLLLGTAIAFLLEMNSLIGKRPAHQRHDRAE